MKKILKIIPILIFVVFFSVSIFHKIVSNTLITKIGKYSVLKVLSGSMEPDILVGDIIIIEKCQSYEVNDIVTFNVENQYLVTHRIIEIQENNYVTKGDNNNTIDSEKVTLENIDGKVIYNSKLLKLLDKYKLILIIILLILFFW